jgi:hypothetical protein
MSERATPGPWSVHDTGINCLRITAIIPMENVPHEFRDYYGSIASVTQRDEHPRYGAGISRQTCAANARLIAAAPEFQSVASNFEITGPDSDGLVWLVLHGNGTTGKAMFQLGSADRMAAQVALRFEADRRAAIAKAEGGAA